ncbi:MAG TPA: molybdopterin cofactor-binding domain-containing protein [Alphaproteobacteria bacterium]|nr:molybdopterin cofactor-binding domain-containing protein [Alphaproteobacteria bacterium]
MTDTETSTAAAKTPSGVSREAPPETPYVGRPLEREEDLRLLRGRGRFADDIAAPPRTVHAAILRSPHAHATIDSIATDQALAQPGVYAVITGEDVKALSDPFLVVLRQPLHQWSLAVGRVRYVGEPVAMVLADDRYLAEDALDALTVSYSELPVAIDLEEAAKDGAPLVHEEAGTNLVSVRDFTYGDPDAAFVEADHRFSLTTRFPRHSYMPIECFVVVAEYHEEDASYDVLSNFQGPYSTHPVMSRSLRVPGSRLRLRTPRDSGGSFGIKQAVFPYIVLMSLAARIVGRPVKWIEDRYEHLLAANSCPGRVTTIEAAVQDDGKITALKYDQLEDYGAYLRAPMPGPLYRMQGAMTGAYDIPNLAVTNKMVMTNMMPAGLVRGFGGPQLYLALERMTHRIAEELGLDHLDVIRKNLVPAGVFPYRAAGGSLLDSGDYPKALEIATGEGRLEDLRRRRDEARAAGKLYGIGFAAAVEPGMSNMGYISNLLTAEERERAGPKNGAVSLATVNVDPLGTVSVTADCMPQGQGHETTLAQIVADQLGLKPDDITVNLEHDTQKDQWSIAAGTYSCRFAPGTAVAMHQAAGQVRAKLATIAAKNLNVRPDDLEFANGKIHARGNPDNAVAFGRAAGVSHWAPAELPEGLTAGLRETASWTPPELEAPTPGDHINTSLTYGFMFDMCGVEVDPVTAQVRIDRYVTIHDSGTLLNPLIAKGQYLGSFAQGVGTALHEEYVYGEDGSFQTGTFADYIVPTVNEVPELELLHMESPSPFTPLGAKGLGEGNCMTTPVCIANAVADALGVKDVQIPLTPKRLHALMADTDEPAPPEGAMAPEAARVAGGRAVAGSGSLEIAAPPQTVWKALLDPEVLRAVIPGCHALEETAENQYRAQVTLGVGPVRGRFDARVSLSDLEPPHAATLSGGIDGSLGQASGAGRVRLAAAGTGTRIDYDYTVDVSGKAAAVGARMMKSAADIVIAQFFRRFARQLGEGAGGATRGSFWRRLMRALGLAR